MKIKRIFSIIAPLYILSILILPRLIQEQTMNHIWNPYSLLHIPLYGVLMLLLSFAFWPRLLDPVATSFNPSALLLPGGIAFLTGVLDEANQIFIPGRDASITDLLLNLSGIVLAALVIYIYQKRKKRIKS